MLGTRVGLDETVGWACFPFNLGGTWILPVGYGILELDGSLQPIERQFNKSSPEMVLVYVESTLFHDNLRAC